MKEKHKNGWNILIMIFTKLKKYLYSKKCLKQRRQPPTPPSSKVESIFTPKKSPGYGCYRGPTCTHSKQGLWLAGKTKRDGDMTMPLSLKTIGSAGYRDQWNKMFGCV